MYFIAAAEARAGSVKAGPAGGVGNDAVSGTWERLPAAGSVGAGGGVSGGAGGGVWALAGSTGALSLLPAMSLICSLANVGDRANDCPISSLQDCYRER